MRNLLPVIAALLSVLSASAQASSYEEAVTAMHERDYELAAQRFQQTIDQSPPWAAGHVALAQCQFMLGLPEDATASLTRAVEIDPAVDALDVYLFAGRHLYDEKRYDEAILPLDQALRRAPEAQRSPLSTRLATALFQTGEYDEASERFQQHIDQFGFDASSAYFLALSLRQVDKPVSALETLERAFEGGLSAERETRAIERLARWSVEHAWDAQDSRERLRRMARAVAYTTLWRDRDPENPVVLALWFDSLHAGEQIPEAIRWLEKHTGDNRCFEQTLLAEAYAFAGRGGAALRQAHKAIRCDEGAGRAHYALALALLTEVGTEYDTSTAASAALESLTQAGGSIRRAIGRDPTIESRAAKLERRIEVTERKLVAARDDLARRETDVLVAMDARLLMRCKAIYWNLKNDPRAVTDEDRSLYDDNDCRERVLRAVPRD